MTPRVNPLLEMTRKLGLLWRSVVRLLQDRQALRQNLGHLRRSYRAGGLQHLKGALLSIPPKVEPGSWIFYQHLLATNVLPRIRNQIASQGAPVLVSIIAPTYNAEPGMLKQMLYSVKNQVYPN